MERTRDIMHSNGNDEEHDPFPPLVAGSSERRLVLLVQINGSDVGSVGRTWKTISSSDPSSRRRSIMLITDAWKAHKNRVKCGDKPKYYRTAELKITRAKSGAVESVLQRAKICVRAEKL
jgi:hypothetical protein